MVAPFLRIRGFKGITDQRKGNSQTIIATSPDSARLVMNVRLCWPEATYSAAQITATLKHDDWIATLSEKVKRDRAKGMTHILLVAHERVNGGIACAALIRLPELLPVWLAQRGEYQRLIESGQLGARRRNPCENGSSPTIYVQDDRAPQAEAVLWRHPGVEDLAKIEPNRLPDEEGNRAEPKDEANYLQQAGDRRQLVERQIRERRGQQRFRDALCQRYNSRCVVTGCGILAVLEAAHISPYHGENDNHPQNGLLLRADIHTLFDLNLIGIEPNCLQVELHPDIAEQEDYRALAGNTLSCSQNRQPSRQALRSRYEQFRGNLGLAEDHPT